MERLALDYDDFPATCEVCNVPFIGGERIGFKPGSGLIVHARCMTAPEPGAASGGEPLSVDSPEVPS